MLVAAKEKQNECRTSEPPQSAYLRSIQQERPEDGLSLDESTHFLNISSLACPNAGFETLVHRYSLSKG